jgi:hypothetical protein
MSANLDAAKDSSPEVDPRKVCRSSDECVLVNWGCCDDPCWGGLLFTTAVNQAFKADVYRVGSCGQVCAAPTPCGFVVSASCDEGACAVHCSGECPVSSRGDGSVIEAFELEITATSDSR